MTAHGLKDGNNVSPFFAGQNRAAVNKNARSVHARHSDAAGRHVFIAATNGNKAIKTLCTDDGLNGVGDHFAGYQRIAHPRRTHGNTIRYRNGIEQHRLGPGFISTHGRCFRQFVNVHIAGGHHAPSRGNANLRFVEVLGFESGGVQHCAARGLLNTVNNNGTVGAFVSHLLFFLNSRAGPRALLAEYFAQHFRAALPVVKRLFALG